MKITDMRVSDKALDSMISFEELNCDSLMSYHRILALLELKQRREMDRKVEGKE